MLVFSKHVNYFTPDELLPRNSLSHKFYKRTHVAKLIPVYKKVFKNTNSSNGSSSSSVVEHILCSGGGFGPLIVICGGRGPPPDLTANFNYQGGCNAELRPHPRRPINFHLCFEFYFFDRGRKNRPMGLTVLIRENYFIVSGF